MCSTEPLGRRILNVVFEISRVCLSDWRGSTRTLPLQRRLLTAAFFPRVSPAISDQWFDVPGLFPQLVSRSSEHVRLSEVRSNVEPPVSGACFCRYSFSLRHFP